MYKRLFRSRHNRVIAGVCGGLGDYFAMDPVILRLIMIIALLLGGVGLLFYIIAWLVIPLEPAL